MSNAIGLHPLLTERLEEAPMSEPLVRSQTTDLEVSDRKVAEMGCVAEKMLAEALESLASFNVDLARSVVGSETHLDVLKRAIEEQAILIIARRQARGIELRGVMAAIRVAGDLERIGDLAQNISKRLIKIRNEICFLRAMVGLRRMGELAALQLKDVLDAFAQHDPARTKSVWPRDNELDALDSSIFRELVTLMMDDPSNISFCAQLLFCTKNIERVGDHTTNIAETVHYRATGCKLPLNRPRGSELARI